MQEEIREISIKEILRKLLYRYKIILLAALVGMGLMILYGVYQTSKVPDTEQLTDAQMKGVESIIPVYDKLHYYEEYYKNSLRLKERTETLKYAVIQYYIASEETNNYFGSTVSDYTNTVAALYSTYINSYQFANELKSLYGENTEVSCISELISVSTVGDILEISVLKTEGVETEAICNAVEEIVSRKASENKKIVDHTIELVEAGESIIKSDTIVNDAITVWNTIDTCKKTITTKLQGLDEQQKEFIMDVLTCDECKENIGVSDSIETNKMSTIFNVKKMLLGFFGGIVIACVIYCIIFLLSDKLQYVNDMKVTYGINLFGTINYKKQTADSQINNIIESVGLYCDKKNINVLSVLTGSKIAEMDCIEKIIAGLKEKGVMATVFSYSEDATDALKKATESGNVLFVEKIEESKYSAIRRQIDILELYNVGIIGSIVMSKY